MTTLLSGGMLAYSTNKTFIPLLHAQNNPSPPWISQHFPTRAWNQEEEEESEPFEDEEEPYEDGDGTGGGNNEDNPQENNNEEGEGEENEEGDGNDERDENEEENQEEEENEEEEEEEEEEKEEEEEEEEEEVEVEELTGDGTEQTIWVPEYAQCDYGRYGGRVTINTARKRMSGRKRALAFTLRTSPSKKMKETSEPPIPYQNNIMTWRNEEAIPSTYERGESSNSTSIHPLTGEAVDDTVPLLVARMLRMETRMEGLNSELVREREQNGILSGRVMYLEGSNSETENNVQQLRNEMGTTLRRLEGHDTQLNNIRQYNHQTLGLWNNMNYWSATVNHRLNVNEMREATSNNRAVMYEARNQQLEQRIGNQEELMATLHNQMNNLQLQGGEMQTGVNDMEPPMDWWNATL